MAYIVDIADAKQRFPEYDFIAPLTPSAFKSAFHVKDSDGKDLCLKLISPNCGLDRLNREIQAMQQVNAPNVVSLVEYTFSTTPFSQKHYIVEEFIEGDDLEVHLGQPWNNDKVFPIFRGIFSGLVAMEEKSIVHRDLKPSNIRVKNDLTPVVIDFGLARHLELSDLTKTADGAAIGTPLYFAPEQFSGTKYDIDHRTDLFSVGIMLFKALTGIDPFFVSGMTRAELEDKVCNSNEFRNTSEFLALDKKWQLFLNRLLAKKRGDRVNSAEQAVAIIDKLEDS